MRAWNFFGVVGLCLMVLGCAHKEKSARTPSETAAYYPLAVGNSWTYESNLLGEKAQKKIEILRREGPFFYDSEGGTLSVDAFGIRDQKRYLLREPLEVGKEWTNVISVSSVEHYAIVEVGFRCEVPAGKFDRCVRVQGRNRVDEKTTLVLEQTFAPEVGLVRIDTLAETGGRKIPQFHLELVSYHVVPGK